MKNSNISFGTNIVFRNLNGFERTAAACQKSVDSYTADSTVKAHSVFTKDIKVCTAGGIITRDPQEKDLNVVMFHINPFNAKNFDFQYITDKIKASIADGIPVEGFVLGCKKTVEGSAQMFDNLENFIGQFHIPISKLKGSPEGADFIDIAYNGYKDELTVFSTAAGRFSKKLTLDDIPKIFDEIKIAPIDHLSVDTTI